MMDVIKALYPQVVTLESWLCQCDGSGLLRSTLIKDHDTQSYKDLVQTTIVALSEASVQNCSFSLSQNLHQREVVLRTIEKLIKRDGIGKNILTLGFNVISDDVDAHVSSGANVEYRYPNNNVNRLHFKVWKQLLSRIGDSLMMYLLEKASIFILLAPTCYLQIAGSPIYNAWPYEVGKTFPIRQAVDQNRRFSHKTKQRKENTAAQIEAVNQISTDLKKVNDDKNEGTKRKASDEIINLDRTVENGSKRARVETGNYFDRTNVQEHENMEKSTSDFKQCIKTQAASSMKEDGEGDDMTVNFRIDVTTEAVVKHLNSDSGTSLKRKRDLEASELTDHDVPEEKRFKVHKESPNNEMKTGKDILLLSSTNANQPNHKSLPVDTGKSESLFSVGKSSVIGRTTDDRSIPGNIHVKENSFSNARNEGKVADPENSPVNKHMKGDLIDTVRKRRRRKKKVNSLNVPVNGGYETTAVSNADRDHCSTAGCQMIGEHEMVRTDSLEAIQRFKPYDHLIYLPRTDILYSRNIRERVQRSVTLASLGSGSGDAAQILYQKIFCQTSVNADALPIEVMVPDSVQVIAPELTVSSSGRGSERIHLDNGSQNVNSNSNVYTGNNLEELKSSDMLSPVTNSSNGSFNSETESSKVSQVMQNRTVLGDHPSFINSGRSTDIKLSDKTDDSFTNSDNGNSDRIVTKGHPSFTNTTDFSFTSPGNKTAMKGHPSFTDSKYDLNYTLETITGKSDVNILNENLGKTKLDMLMQRRLSVLNQRKQAPNTSSHKMTPSSVCCNSVAFDRSSSGSGDSGLVNQENTGNFSTSLASDVESKSNSKDSNSSADDCKSSVRDNRSVDGLAVDAESKKANSSPEETVELVDKHKTDAATTDSQTRGNNETSEQIIEKIHHSDDTEFTAARNRTEKRDENARQEHAQVENTVLGDGAQGVEGVANNEMGKLQILANAKLMELLNEFAERHRRCPYKVLLQHHCPVSWKQRGDKSSLRRKHVAKATVARLLTDHIHPRQVYLFMRACFLKTFPPDLLGSSNRNIVLKNISRLISMGKFEKLCLGQLMAGLKTSEIPWLQHLLSNNLKLHLLAKLIYWIFKHYVFTLLKTYFYVTETTFIKYRLLYYRQSVWHKLHLLQFSQLLRKKIIRPLLGENVAEEMLRTGRSLGVCFLRFIPKQGSLRPIMNMSRTTPQLTSKKLSINQQLMDLLHILTYMKNKNPSIIGAGKFGMDDVYASWSEYHQKWNKLGKPELHFVKTDIINCYDTILQNKLYSVLQDVFSQMEEEFLVRKYASVLVARGNLKRTFHRAVSPLSEYEPDFVRVAKGMISQNSMHDVILVDKVLYQHESKESLLQLLQKHLFNNTIKVGSKYYHQICGISQGSVLSTLLCSLYYANMERDYLEIGKDDLLMRIVDDYLYVTPSKKSATRFLNQMLNGIPGYNCHVNAEKVLTNFEYASEKFGKVAYTKETFPWCGMVLDTEKLEVGVDYGRYAGFKISDSITFDLCHRPGLAMKKKILFSSRPKCHSMFMDPNINSECQICVNCYQLFLLSVYKFHTYNIRFPCQQRAEKNPRFFYGVIRDLSKYVYTQANKQLKSKRYAYRTVRPDFRRLPIGRCFLFDIIHSLKREVSCKRQRQDTSSVEQFPVGDNTIKWLCLKAFQSVLHYHHSLYKEVLGLIRKDLRALERSKVSSKSSPLEKDTMLKLDRQFAELFH